MERVLSIFFFRADWPTRSNDMPKPYKIVDWDQMILDKRDARNTKIKLAAEKNRKKQLLENKPKLK